jgi:hypothetical protein
MARLSLPAGTCTDRGLNSRAMGGNGLEMERRKAVAAVARFDFFGFDFMLARFSHFHLTPVKWNSSKNKDPPVVANIKIALSALARRVAKVLRHRLWPVTIPKAGAVARPG